MHHQHVRHPILAQLAAALKPAARRKGLTLGEIISVLPKQGQGYRVSRRIWTRYEEPCYYTIHHVKPARHGHDFVVYAQLVFRGNTDGKVHRLKRYAKRGWKLVQLEPEPDFKPKLPVRTHRKKPKQLLDNVIDKVE